jgi:hypothetical protein
VWAVHGRVMHGRRGTGRRRGNAVRFRENWTLGVAAQRVGVVVVLLRAKGRGLMHRDGLSTTARRWRPEMARARRGARGRSHQGRGKKPRLGGDDAWKSFAAGGGARGAGSTASGGGRSGAEREAARARGRRSRGCQED